MEGERQREREEKQQTDGQTDKQTDRKTFEQTRKQTDSLRFTWALFIFLQRIFYILHSAFYMWYTIYDIPWYWIHTLHCTLYIVHVELNFPSYASASSIFNSCFFLPLYRCILVICIHIHIHRFIPFTIYHLQFPSCIYNIVRTI